MSHGAQTEITSASITTSPPLIPTPTTKEFKYEPQKQEDDDDEDDYDDDDNFVEDEAIAYGRENVCPLASPYLMPCVFSTRNMASERMVICS